MIAMDDNFADICNDCGAVAIFECNTVFFGLLGFKPKELFIFTAKGLRIVAHEKLKFHIPMSHIKEVKVDFSSAQNSIIYVRLTTEYASHIERSIELANNAGSIANEKNFSSVEIILICDKLCEVTKEVLRVIFPQIYDIDVKKSEQILRTLGRTTNNLIDHTFSEAEVCTLTEPSTLSGGESILDANLKITKTETVDNGAIAVSSKLVDSIDLSAPSSSPKSLHENCVNLPFGIINLTKVETMATADDDNCTIMEYHFDEGVISLNIGDYKCLTSGEYLNDKIIDFYMKYIQNEICTDKDRRRTYIFNTYFYYVLTCKGGKNEKTDKRSEAQRRHDRIKNWTKNVNIFEKDFIIVPVNERSHWCVIVICFANMLMPVNCNFNKNNEQSGDAVNKPVILIFNSMAGFTNYRTTSILREYLTSEYHAKVPNNVDPPNFTKDTLPGHRVKVPQQDNLYDCGIFVLQYVEEFFKQPIQDFRLPINQISEWFDSMTTVRKREQIAKIIQRLIDEHHQAMGTRPKFKLPNIQFPTLDGKWIPQALADDKDVEIVEAISK